MASSTPSYEGGTGGKFRKRPLRRAAATPYDRPAAAAGGGLRVLPAPSSEENNGWLSKFVVDPASRIIARSASRFFSSVFGKRLGGPPEAPQEKNLQSGQEVNAVVCTNPPLEVRERGGNDAENKMNNSSTDVARRKGSCHTDGIFELEQLLEQKTFTRVEFNRLAELLRTRTIEPSTSHPAVSCEKKENTNHLGKENGIRCIGSDGDISNSAVKATMPVEEFTYAEELAKVYMGSRPSKVPSSALSSRNQIVMEDTNFPCNASYGRKISDLSTGPRSVVRFSGIPDVTENGYRTPRPIGRSAMHRMSRSPYFKAPSIPNFSGGELHRDSNGGPSTSSQLMVTNFMHSGGKQVRKRGNSVLDDDFGSSGPIRRIRQKSNLMSPSKNMRSILTGNVFPSPSSPIANDISQWSVASMQKHLSLDGPKDGASNSQHAENGDSKGSVLYIPPQSSDMERKALQELDKAVTSPNEISFKPRAIVRGGLPSRLTENMLHERALSSMKDIDSSKFFNLPGNGNLDAPCDADVPILRSLNSQNLRNVEDKVPSKSAFSGVEVMYEHTEMVPVKSTTGANPGLRTTDFAISGSAAVPLPKKPSFQMTAPEDIWDMDDDDYNTVDASDTSITENNKFEPKILEGKINISDAEILEKSLPYSSESTHTSGSMVNREADMKASNRPAAGKDNGFSFHVAPAPVTFSQSPPTPSIASPLLDRSAPQTEQTAAAGFVSGSKESHSSVLPTTTTRISDSASLKSNASDVSTTALEGPNCNNGGKRPRDGDISRENAAFPITSTLTSPASGALGASTISSLSNGSLTSASSTFLISPAAALQFSNSVTSTLSASTTASNCSSGLSVSSTPMFSTVTSGALTGVPIPASSFMDKLNSTGLEGMPDKASPFSTSVSSLGASAFSNTGASSSALATSSSSTSIGTPSSVATSLFSSSGSSSSALPMTSAGSKQDNGIFGFSGPSQPSTFGTGGTQAVKGIFGSFTSSPASGLTAFAPSGSGSLTLGSAAPGLQPFGSTTGTSFPAGAATSSSANESSLAPAATTSLFSSSSQTPTSSSTGFLFGQSNATSSSQQSTSTFSSSTSFPSTGFSFGQSAPASSSSVFGSSTSPSTGFSFGQSAPGSSSQTSSSAVFGSSASSPSTGFSFGQSAAASSSQPSSQSVFGSSTSPPSTGLSFGQAAAASSSQPFSSAVFGSTTASSSTGFSFGQLAPASSSKPSSSSVFGSITSSPSTGFSFGQSSTLSAQPSTSSTSAGFIFGQSAPTSGSSSFMFGASSGAPFSFTSAGTATSASLASPTSPAFGLSAPATGFSSGSPGGDQMNVEDMADDTSQAAAAAPMVPTFGQPAATLNFTFGSPAIPTGGTSVFQFGSQQNPAVSQSPSPFQTGGNLEFSGGSFSLGSTGGDKSGRKIVKINRNKHRKK